MFAIILIVTIVFVCLATAAIAYYASTHSNEPEVTATPSPTQMSIQEEVRDQIMQYIKINHSDTAQFINDLVWTGGRATPEGLVGSETYKYFSSGWNVTITYPVVPNPIYRVTADYSSTGVGIGIPYRVIWEGTWQNEVINETSYTFAQ